MEFFASDRMRDFADVIILMDVSGFELIEDLETGELLIFRLEPSYDCSGAVRLGLTCRVNKFYSNIFQF